MKRPDVGNVAILDYNKPEAMGSASLTHPTHRVCVERRMLATRDRRDENAIKDGEICFVFSALADDEYLMSNFRLFSKMEFFAYEKPAGPRNRYDKATIPKNC